jgi:hypothetical protein
MGEGSYYIQVSSIFVLIWYYLNIFADPYSRDLSDISGGSEALCNYDAIFRSTLYGIRKLKIYTEIHLILMMSV